MLIAHVCVCVCVCLFVCVRDVFVCIYIARYVRVSVRQYAVD